MQSKFKVGDYVTCNIKGYYSVTDFDVICRVISVRNDNYMTISPCDKKSDGTYAMKNDSYSVQSKLFDKYQPMAVELL